MKKLTVGTIMLGPLISLLALAGCDTPVDSETENRYDDTGRTYTFNADGIYEFKNGDNVLDGGSYLVKDDSLFLLRDYTYGSSAAVAAAVEHFTFTKDETAATISLVSGLGTTIYSLDPGGVPTRTARDSFKGKKWRSGLNPNSMWNLWDFNDDGTFQYIHHHTETNTKDVGLFSYVVHGGYLVTVAPREKNTEMGPSFEPYQVSAYSLQSLDLTFSASPAASGGSAVYTLAHEGDALYDESTHSYEFVHDGTYIYDGSAAGTYLIRNNVLVLLPTAEYSDATAVLTAAQKYFFDVSADSKISLISDAETHVYTLSGTIPASITAPERDKLAGKFWKVGTSPSMWNWYGFRNNGTFHFYHFMSSRADYIDRGDFSYLLQGDKLLILSAFDSNTKSPSLPPYTVAAYTLGTSNDTPNALTGAAGNPTNTPAAVTRFTEISDTSTYKDSSDNALPPATYDDGFTGSGNNNGGDHEHAH
ncbi:MAG: hypothetical protein LBF75_05595 [Treponema sp.]|jgi:hypothetical protein|nr:hypothetical protein [Treponema sp.]